MKRYLSKHQGNTRIAKGVEKDLDVYWDQEFHNWVVFWRGSMVMEYAHKEPFHLRKIHKYLDTMKNNRYREMAKQQDRQNESVKEKFNKESREAAEYVSKELYHYLDNDLIYTSKSGQRTILKPNKRKSFTYKE